MEDVTIEDEFNSNEEIPPNSQLKSKSTSSIIFQILNYQWIIWLFLLFLIGIYYYLKKYRQKNPISVSNNKQDDSYNEYDRMEKVRQRQQKIYEEQALRYAEQKKAKTELLKTNVDEKRKPLKYRSDDHNPLTGQSNSGTNNSCSWRSSSKRKPAGG